MQPGTVAVLVGNPALRSILVMTLAASPHLRVRDCASLAALEAQLRLVPVDLVVMDLDLEAARSLRALPLRSGVRFDLVALTAKPDPSLPQAARAAGIDELLLKPLSPRYLLERVLSRLARRVALCAPPAPAPVWSQFGDNVIPLFPQPQG
jgi:DNA-binding NarL/FixJ family response regulator